MIHITTQELLVRSPFAFSSVQFSAGGGVVQPVIKFQSYSYLLEELYISSNLGGEV